MAGNVHRERTHDQSAKPRKFREQRVLHHGPDSLLCSLMEWETINSNTNRMQPKELKGYNVIVIHRCKWRMSVQWTECTWRVCPLPCHFCAMSLSVSLIVMPQSREVPHIYYWRCDSNEQGAAVRNQIANKHWQHRSDHQNNNIYGTLAIPLDLLQILFMNNINQISNPIFSVLSLFTHCLSQHHSIHSHRLSHYREVHWVQFLGNRRVCLF